MTSDTRESRQQTMLSQESTGSQPRGQASNPSTAAEASDPVGKL